MLQLPAVWKKPNQFEKTLTKQSQSNIFFFLISRENDAKALTASALGGIKRSFNVSLCTQTIKQCIQRRVDLYKRDTHDYKVRKDALIKMLVETGSLIALVVHPAFVAYSRILDCRPRISSARLVFTSYYFVLTIIGLQIIDY